MTKVACTIKKKLPLVIAASMLLTMLLGACSAKPSGNAENTQAPAATTETSVEKKTEAPKEAVTVNVGYMPNIHAAAPIVVGEEKGYYKENGIKTNAVKFLSGPPLLQAMAAGDIDIGYIGPGATFLAAQGQAKIVTIDNIYYGDMVVATKKSGVSKIEDIKGKSIATPKGTSGEGILNLALRAKGLNPADFNINNMDVAGCVAAFVAGKVDVVAIWAPYTLEMEKQVGKENMVKLVTNRDFPEQSFPGSWVVRPDFLEKNKDVVVRFFKGWAKANDFRKANLSEAAKLTAAFTQVPEDQLLGMGSPELTDFFEAKKLDEMLKDGTVNKIYDGLVKNFVKDGKLKEYVDPNKFLAPEVMAEVLK